MKQFLILSSILILVFIFSTYSLVAQGYDQTLNGDKDKLKAIALGGAGGGCNIDYLELTTYSEPIAFPYLVVNINNIQATQSTLIPQLYVYIYFEDFSNFVSLIPLNFDTNSDNLVLQSDPFGVTLTNIGQYLPNDLCNYDRIEYFGVWATIVVQDQNNYIGAYSEFPELFTGIFGNTPTRLPIGVCCNDIVIDNTIGYNEDLKNKNQDELNSNGIITHSNGISKFPNTIDNNYMVKYSLSDLNTTVVNKKHDKKDNLEVFPNPFSDYINLDYSSLLSEEVKIKVVDLKGKVLLNTIDFSITPNQSRKINLSTLASGIYFIQIKIRDNTYFKKIIKN